MTQRAGEGERAGEAATTKEVEAEAARRKGEEKHEEARQRDEEEARKNVGPKPGPLKVVDEEAFQRFINSCYEAGQKVSRCTTGQTEAPRWWHGSPTGSSGRPPARCGKGRQLSEYPFTVVLPVLPPRVQHRQHSADLCVTS